MSGIKVCKFVYGRLRSPDLDLTEQFLTDFGMVRAARTPKALYMRGTDPEPFVHVTELGDPKVLGFGYYARSEDDLKALTKLEGATDIESPDEPGGGRRVRLQDPFGLGIEVLFGQNMMEPLPVDEYKVNWGGDKIRRTELMRVPAGPAPIQRAGHGVLMTTDISKTLRWYRETLGFLSSDEIYVGDKNNLVGSFNRIDNGADYVDHHVFFAIAGAKNGLHHLSYEARDIDAIMAGHERLKSKGYRHAWGVGRHLLGSQVFDYWYDPWGRIHEHWADSDVLNASAPANLWAAEDAQRHQWGPEAPADFIRHASS